MALRHSAGAAPVPQGQRVIAVIERLKTLRDSLYEMETMRG